MEYIERFVNDDGLGGRKIELTGGMDHSPSKIYIAMYEDDGKLEINWMGDAADIAAALNDLPGWTASFEAPKVERKFGIGAVVKGTLGNDMWIKIDDDEWRMKGCPNISLDWSDAYVSNFIDDGAVIQIQEGVK